MWLWFPEGQEGIVAQLRRATVLKTDDSGTQQILKKMTGAASEQFEDVYRPQQHGFSSHAPKGSEGVFLALGGRSDRLLALGFEHKKYRPKDTPEGGAVIYNHTGDVVRVFKDNTDVVHSKLINIKIGKGNDVGQGDGDQTNVSIVLKGGDSLTITYDNSSAKFEGGKITLKSPHVIVKADRVDLGDEGGEPVGLCGGGCATKVFAV
ncbi:MULTISPECIES: phage baseplate assembly protein [unclassified Bradyrhizobium]|uniref:phage baseplate assembly protein domain-containing protein n=1 Tax=unclassified Bradyrhizobium TaxID=2631580 RepID=UPI002916C1F0|nr:MULTISPECIES: phage baseplate assembly protein [unclassified Bradyrhizobium]